MKRFFLPFLLAAVTICLFPSCSSDNNDDNEEIKVPELVNGTTNWFDVTFTKIDDGGYTYDGGHQISSGALGQGWKLIATYPIESNGRLSRKQFNETLDQGRVLQMMYLNPDGTRLTNYYLPTSSENPDFYTTYNVKYNDDGWIKPTTSAAGYDGSIQILDVWVKDLDKPTFMMAAIVHKNSITTTDGQKEQYGVRFYQSMDKDDVSKIMNEHNFNGDNYAPDSCRFYIKVSSDVENEYVYAPFEQINFELTDDKLESGNPYAAFNYFDSIVWKRADGTGTSVRLYEKKRNGYSLTYKWSNYFFDKDRMETLTEGWRNGEVMYRLITSIPFRLRDFLCYDWADGAQADGTTISLNVADMLNPDTEYQLIQPRKDAQGHLYSRLYVWPKPTQRDMTLDEEVEILHQLMKGYFPLCRAVTDDAREAKIRANFHCLPAKAKILYHSTWENTNMVLVREDPDEENDTDGRVYILAEPNEQ